MSVVIVRSSCGCGISPGCPRCRGSGTVFRLSDSDDFSVGAPDEVDRLRAELDEAIKERDDAQAQCADAERTVNEQDKRAWTAEQERDELRGKLENAVIRAINAETRADSLMNDRRNWMRDRNDALADRDEWRRRLDALKAMNDRQALALMEADKRGIRELPPLKPYVSPASIATAMENDEDDDDELPDVAPAKRCTCRPNREEKCLGCS